jgi:hypothetical protein
MAQTTLSSLIERTCIEAGDRIDARSTDHPPNASNYLGETRAGLDVDKLPETNGWPAEA